MKRSICPALLVLAVSVADPASRALAQSPDSAMSPYAAEIVSQLRVMGYERFTVRRTLLGRIRIVAELPDADTREIIVNPRTGEILRDYVDGDGVDRLIAREQPGRFRPDDYENDDRGWSDGRGSSGRSPSPDSESTAGGQTPGEAPISENAVRGTD